MLDTASSLFATASVSLFAISSEKGKCLSTLDCRRAYTHNHTCFFRSSSLRCCCWNAALAEKHNCEKTFLLAEIWLTTSMQAPFATVFRLILMWIWICGHWTVACVLGARIGQRIKHQRERQRENENTCWIICSHFAHCVRMDPRSKQQ